MVDIWHNCNSSYSREWLRYWLVELDLYSRCTCGSTAMPVQPLTSTGPYWHTLCTGYSHYSHKFTTIQPCYLH